MGFAEEKIEHFAKLKQKEAKNTLEREKQVRLEKRNNKKKHNKENAKKTIIVQLQIKPVNKKRDARRSWRKANSSYSGVRTETKRPFHRLQHFIGRDIAGLRQNIDFQPQKVGGQRIGFAHKD